MNKKNLLYLNLSVDEKDVSLGFAKTWTNQFSENFENVDKLPKSFKKCFETFGQFSESFKKLLKCWPNVWKVSQITFKPFSALPKSFKKTF